LQEEVLIQNRDTRIYGAHTCWSTPSTLMSQPSVPSGSSGRPSASSTQSSMSASASPCFRTTVEWVVYTLNGICRGGWAEIHSVCSRLKLITGLFHSKSLGCTAGAPQMHKPGERLPMPRPGCESRAARNHSRHQQTYECGRKADIISSIIRIIPVLLDTVHCRARAGSRSTEESMPLSGRRDCPLEGTAHTEQPVQEQQACACTFLNVATIYKSGDNTHTNTTSSLAHPYRKYAPTLWASRSPLCLRSAY
jgi:hypothetical protein